MNRLKIVLVCLVFWGFFGSNSTIFGQCYVQVIKQCVHEGFDNSCGESCSIVGASCGMAVGSFPIHYADVGPAAPGEGGEDGFADVPNGLLQCGEVLQCTCFKRTTGVFYCGLDQFPVVLGNYDVHQKEPFGDPCEGEEDSVTPPVVIVTPTP